MALFRASLVLALASGLALHADTKLSRAAISGDLTDAKSRIAAGEKVTDFDKWGWTALHWAVYYGQDKMALWLLENGADANAKTIKDYGDFKAGVTPLIFAGYYGHPEVAAALLKQGARKDEQDGKGMTAMDYAKQWKFDAVITVLEAAPAKP